MDEKKQIEKIREIIRHCDYVPTDACANTSCTLCKARRLYEAGARIVVKCKECVHYVPYPKPVEDFDGRCSAGRGETDENDFCSWGAKMGGDAE